MSHPNFKTTELDATVLSTPFSVRTNWHVITGAACSGKTTLIDLLAETGFQIIPESARQYFNEEMAKGRTLEAIRADGSALQRAIVLTQRNLEQSVQATNITFLDRAIPDSLTFYRVYGMDPNEILPACFIHRYATVFILDRLAFQREQMLGPEDDVTSSFLDEWLVRDYNALGYSVIRVPVLSPAERLAYILKNLSPTLATPSRRQVTQTVGGRR